MSIYSTQAYIYIRFYNTASLCPWFPLDSSAVYMSNDSITDIQLYSKRSVINVQTKQWHAIINVDLETSELIAYIFIHINV